MFSIRLHGYKLPLRQVKSDNKESNGIGLGLAGFKMGRRAEEQDRLGGPIGRGLSRVVLDR